MDEETYAGVAVDAEEDERVRKGLELGVDPALKRLPDLSVVLGEREEACEGQQLASSARGGEAYVVDERARVHGSRLNDRVVPNLRRKRQHH